MCGISLIISKNKLPDDSAIQSMSHKIAHRGPDDFRYVHVGSLHSHYYFAVNRLSISDHSFLAGQPMISEDKRYALIYNGEIYNFPDLKNELITRGIQFNTKSDTEVLFHWLILFEEERIDQLHGMFAFAFIDLKKEKTIIARDRFGIKPVYYFKNREFFMLCSEIKGITGSGLIPFDINIEQASHYFTFRYPEPPATFIKNILEVPHNTCMIIEKDHIQSKKIYEHQPLPQKKTLEPDIQETEQIIKDNLLLQLQADVPVGLLLSGGVDSTLLLALARSEGYRMPTFSVVNSAQDRSFGTKDYHYGRLAAKTFDSDHTETEINDSILSDLDPFIDSLDQPVADSGALMTYHISRIAGKQVKVLLSGAGADELFAGYNRHYAFYTYLKYQSIVKSLQPVLKPASVFLPTGFPHPWRNQFRLIRQWLQSCKDAPGPTFIEYLKIPGLPENITCTKKPAMSSWTEDPVYHALTYDRNNYLIHDVLAISDGMTMAENIELRVPYLNEELVSYLANYPAESLIKKGRKWLLKKILSNHNGKKFISRPKEGFGLPFGNWIRKKKNDYIWEPLYDTSNPFSEIFDMDVFKKLLNSHKSGFYDYSQILWAILVLGRWINRFHK